MTLPAPVGGFFELHEPDGAAAGPSILDAWTRGRPHAAFVNARSAFAALAGLWPEATVWLPAFLCRDLIHASFSERVRFYGVKQGFEPDLASVESAAAAGDLVLLVTYFGLPISPGARAFAARRPDLRIVEDRAQALDVGPGLGAGWSVYSPRKLLGVADGGLLVAAGPSTELPHPTTAADAAALWAAPLLRREDPRNNALWHAANQAKEGAMSVTREAMTEKSLSILASTSLESLAAPRVRNWRTLDRRLRAWSALPADPPSPPLGYVLRLEPPLRDRVLKGLHAERIFAAVHWPEIAGPTADFPREARWPRELITLPCDHRYDVADMERISARVADLLA